MSLILVFFTSYNLIKDCGFEQPKPKDTWKEELLREGVANSYCEGGYESDYCGETSVWDGRDDGKVHYALLSQEFRRCVKDITELKFWYRWQRQGHYIRYFCVKIVGVSQDTLMYLWYENNPPQEYPWRRIIEMELPPSRQWTLFDRNLFEDWVQEGLSEEDTVKEIILFAYGVTSGNCVKVYWDSIQVLSIRYDFDMSVVDIISNKPSLNEDYVPVARFSNLGFYEDKCVAVFSILKGKEVLYSDSLEVNLEVDDTVDVSFKPWHVTTDNVILKAEVVYPKDQNPENNVKLKSYLGIERRKFADVSGKLRFYDVTGRRIRNPKRIFFQYQNGKVEKKVILER